MKKRLSGFLITLFGVTAAGVLSVTAVNTDAFKNGFSFAAEGTWVHYSAIDPTATSPGIKEFYVNCESHSHSFEKPASYTEGIWTEAKKSEVTTLEDDRYIKSFNSLDAMLEGASGDNAFDYVKINKAYDYYDANYSNSAKAAYTGNVLKAKQNYETSFSIVYKADDMGLANYSGNGYFSLSTTIDSDYGEVSECEIIQEASGTYRSFVWTGTNLQPISNMYSEIAFSVYVSQNCNLLIDMYPEFTDQYINAGKTSLSVGWNTITLGPTSTGYNVLTSFAPGAANNVILRFRSGGTMPLGTHIKISNFICKSPVASLNKRISELPSAENLKSYDYTKINNIITEYESLSSSLQALVVNYSKVTSLKTIWDEQFVMLYDMTKSYAGWVDSTKMSQTVITDSTYGSAKSVTITTGLPGVSLNNVGNAYSPLSLSSIEFYVKPSVDSKMTWSGINNYGTVGVSLTQTANVWNKYEITEAYVPSFMTYFQANTYASTNFLSTVSGETWDSTKNRTNTVGFNFQVTSLIGTKKQTGANEVISAINALPSPSLIGLDNAEALFNIETAFEALSASSQASVTNIDKYYDCKEVYNRQFGYVLSPDLEINCYQYAADGSKDVISYEKNVPTMYGPAYRYKTKATISGSYTWPTYRFEPGELNVEHNGAMIFAKGFTSKLNVSINSYDNYLVSGLAGVSMGNGWYKYVLTKGQVDAILKYDRYVFYKDNSGVKQDTEYMFTGLIAIKDTTSDATKVAAVQEAINNAVTASDVSEYSNIEIESIQSQINTLNSQEQAKLKNVINLDNAYNAYNRKFAKVFSYSIYKMGIPWSGSATNIKKIQNADYGDVFTFSSVADNKTTITFGTWKTTTNYSGLSNQYRGQGMSLTPIELGRYTKVMLKVFNPGSEQVKINFYTRKVGDTGYFVASKFVNAGWNDVVFSGDELTLLAGYNNSEYVGYEGLQIAINDASAHSGWAFAQFVGTLNPAFTGEDYHYATDSLHENAYNIDRMSTKLFECGSSVYKLVYNDWEMVGAPIEFLNKSLRKTVGVSLNPTTGITYSPNSRYIFVNDLVEMNRAGISEIPSYDELSTSGYIIKRVHNSIFIYAYTQNGYRNAFLKFLKEGIGFDQLGGDMTICESNGVQYTNNFVAYLPDFNVIEKPDYDVRVCSNNNNKDTNICNAMGLDTFSFIMTKDESGKSMSYFHNAQDYLPRSELPSYYWHDDTKTGWGEAYEYQLCYTGKGNSSNYQDMIERISNRIISMARANPERSFATVGQCDCNGHCDCAGCQAIYNQHGGNYSSVVIKFMNDLDDAIKAKYTDRTIYLLFFAYHTTLKTPENKTSDVICHDNIGPMIAPSKARWEHSFYEEENSTGAGEVGAESGKTYSYDNDFASQVEEWNDFCKFKYIWAYQTNFAHDLYMYNTFDSMYDQYRFFYNNGAAIMANEGNWLDNGSGFIALKDYLDSKALYDVNGSFDEVYEKFFKYYFGSAGEYMKCLFEEVLNNERYCAIRYGKGNTYNPTDTSAGKTYWTGGVSFTMNQTKYWDGNNNVYNGGPTTNSTKNIANITRWLSYIDSALMEVDGDSTLEKHVKQEALFIYLLAHDIQGSTAYDSLLVDASYICGTYYLSEADYKADYEKSLTWGNGTNTICYKFSGQTYKERFGL